MARKDLREPFPWIASQQYSIFRRGKFVQEIETGPVVEQRRALLDKSSCL